MGVRSELTCLVRAGVLLLQLVRFDCGVGRILLVLAVLHLGLRLDLGQDPGSLVNSKPVSQEIKSKGGKTFFCVYI